MSYSKRKVAISTCDTWQWNENGDDLEIQKDIEGVGWVTKGSIGGNETSAQPPEVGDEPVIFAPEMVALNFSNQSISQEIEGVSVADEDSLSLIMDVTATSGTLGFPLTSGATYEEISGGIRFTGTIAELNVELAGLEFEPTNLVGPPIAPQDGTIDIILDDQDVATANAEHTITVEVLDSGR